jgi:UDP-glucose:(heptosyl)LPS alpha-1,3-glucosyltransferase
MRIALAHMRHAHSGGTERYLNELAAFLARRGHEVTIVCRRHEAPPHPDVRFVVLHGFALGKSWRTWSFARSLAAHLERHDYDLVFGLGRSWSQDVVRLGWGLHARYLDSLAQFPSGSALGRAFRGASHALRDRVWQRIEERALTPGAPGESGVPRRVITNAHRVAREVRERYGTPEAALATIHNGVDLERFHPRLRTSAGARLRESLGLSSEDLVVLFLGTGYARKGLDLVLAAFPSLLARVPRARLVVAGYDSSAARWVRAAERAGIAPHARFLGGRRDPEACYAAADIYVLPTRYDPFANSTLEALAAGLPVITTSANGASELLEHRRQGSVIDLARGSGALAEELLFWSDPARLRDGAREARELAQRHGIESKLVETERLLLDVARERLAPGPLSVVLLDTLPGFGGGEQWCLDAARALGKLGHRVTIAGVEHGALVERARERGLPTFAGRAGGLASFAFAAALARRMRAERTDVLVANVGRDLRIGALACARSGAALLQRRGIARAARGDLLTRFLYRRRVRRIVVNCAAIERAVRAGAPYLGPERFALVENGVDLAASDHGDRARFRASLGVGPGTPVAAVVGRLAPMKGHEHLLAAWREVRARVPRAVLCVAGEGELEGELRERARALGLGDGVRFLGFQAELADLYRGVDLFVLASVRDEGASHALLAAMAAGLPSVVTDCGGLAETAGEGALVVPPGDPAALARAIAELLGDPGRRARLGASARRRAEERHAPEEVARKLEAVLVSAARQARVASAGR